MSPDYAIYVRQVRVKQFENLPCIIELNAPTITSLLIDHHYKFRPADTIIIDPRKKANFGLMESDSKSAMRIRLYAGTFWSMYAQEKVQGDKAVAIVQREILRTIIHEANHFLLDYIYNFAHAYIVMLANYPRNLFMDRVNPSAISPEEVYCEGQAIRLANTLNPSEYVQFKVK